MCIICELRLVMEQSPKCMYIWNGLNDCKISMSTDCEVSELTKVKMAA
jgi:hypothetical protein